MQTTTFEDGQLVATATIREVLVELALPVSAPDDVPPGS